METAKYEVQVEYANDLDTLAFQSGFPVYMLPPSLSLSLDTLHFLYPYCIALHCILLYLLQRESFQHEEDTPSFVSAQGVELGGNVGEGQDTAMFDEDYYSRTGWNLNLLPRMKVKGNRERECVCWRIFPARFITSRPPFKCVCFLTLLLSFYLLRGRFCSILRPLIRV